MNYLFRRSYVSSKGSGLNEGVHHFRSKQHIYQVLLANPRSTLDIALQCGHQGKFWKCKNAEIVRGWVDNWVNVYKDYNIKQLLLTFDITILKSNYGFTESSELDFSGIEKPEYEFLMKHIRGFLSENGPREDLLLPSSFTERESKLVKKFAEEVGLGHYIQPGFSGRQNVLWYKKPNITPVGCYGIEILEHNEISDESSIEFQLREGIPWIEVRGASSVYEGPSKWTIKDPLPAIKMPEKKRKICKECSDDIQKNLKFERIASLIDIYISGRLSEIIRKTFNIIVRKNENGQDEEFFLLEGGFKFSQDQFSPQESEILIGKSSSLDSLKSIIEKRLSEIKSKKAGVFDEAISWPGINSNEISQKHGDILKTGKYPIKITQINWISPLKYIWSPSTQTWEKRK